MVHLLGERIDQCLNDIKNTGSGETCLQDKVGFIYSKKSEEGVIIINKVTF